METKDLPAEIFHIEIRDMLACFLKKQQLSLRKFRTLYHPDYLEGFDFLFAGGFSPERFYKKLIQTGWKPVVTGGYLTGYHYFQHLIRREIPINIHIRPGDQIDFALFPDMIHDIMGHCPMLISKKYTGFLDEISRFICSIELEERDRRYLALHSTSHKQRQEALPHIEEAEAQLKQTPTTYYYYNSLALWTMEFGIIQDHVHTHAYGAALVASPLEMETLHSGHTPVIRLSDFSVNSGFNFSGLQDSLYATQSLEEAKDNILYKGSVA